MTNPTMSGTGLDPVQALFDVKLVRALQYANEWLRYAESKHVALLGLNATTLTALNVYARPEAKDKLLVILFGIAVVACFASIAWSLTSFFARTDPKKVLPSYMSKGKAMTNTWTDMSADAGTTRLNWVYFGHLAKRTATEVVAGLVGTYDPKVDGGYLGDMAEQVVINSRLALMKALRFNTALKCYVIAPILLLVLMFTK